MHGDNSGHFGISKGPLGRIETLPANQQKALAALLATPSIEAAAEQCGLTARTIKRYLADKTFAACYREQRALVLNETVAGLEKASVDAVAALTGALEDADVGTRIRAARSIIEFMFKGTDMERKNREIDEIEREIEELREMVEASRDRKKAYGH